MPWPRIASTTCEDTSSVEETPIGTSSKAVPRVRAKLTAASLLLKKKPYGRRHHSS